MRQNAKHFEGIFFLRLSPTNDFTTLTTIWYLGIQPNSLVVANEPPMSCINPSPISYCIWFERIVVRETAAWTLANLAQHAELTKILLFFFVSFNYCTTSLDLFLGGIYTTLQIRTSCRVPPRTHSTRPYPPTIHPIRFSPFRSKSLHVEQDRMLQFARRTSERQQLTGLLLLLSVEPTARRPSTKKRNCNSSIK